jgi:hypothetical protein
MTSDISSAGRKARLSLIACSGDIDLKAHGAGFDVRRVSPPPLKDRRSSLVRRLVLAKNDSAKQRIRAWLSDIDDERLFHLGLTSEDVAALRDLASPRAEVTIAQGLAHRQETTPSPRCQRNDRSTSFIYLSRFNSG